jgi:hypothetical protein
MVDGASPGSPCSVPRPRRSSRADLASLDALHRVGSVLALGLLLMLGSCAWQRLRPAPLGDARHQYP